MSKCTRHYVTAETLKAEINSGRHSSEKRNYLIRMSARLSQIGTQIDTVKSTTHVSAGSFAMPVTFMVPVYGISRQKFSAMLRPHDSTSAACRDPS